MVSKMGASLMPRTKFLADIPISIFEQAPELPDDDGNFPTLESRLISEDCAHRRDLRVGENELDSLQTFNVLRQYIVRKDEIYTVGVMQVVGPLGSEPLGSESLGEQPIDRPPVARTGSNARAGDLLRDDETGELFDIAGITRMPDDKRLTIHCASRRGSG